MRDAVLSTARELVVANGADQLRMTEVLRTTGIARGTLYNTVRNKDELLVALVASSIEQLADQVIAAGNGDPHRSLLSLGEALADDHLVVSLRESAARDARNIGWCASVEIAEVGHQAIGRVLAAAGLPNSPESPALELIYRWAVTQVCVPLRGERLASSVALLIKACRA